MKKFDYVVDPSGKGTHTTLAEAIAAAVSAGGDRVIHVRKWEMPRA